MSNETRTMRVPTIGNCVYIGAQSVIAAGVTIGDRCIVSANSLVLDDVESGTAVGGTPARSIGRIEGEGETVRVEWGHKRPISRADTG